MQALNLPNFNEIIFSFFQKHVVEQGFEHKFIQRSSKLNALAFVRAVMASCLSANAVTLEDICRLLKREKISITRQGLHERMNEKAVNMFKELFSLALTQFTSQSADFSELGRLFSHVYLIDSSTVSLPDSMKELYKGCGGNASEAAVKLQVLYEHLGGQIKELTLTAGCENDQGFNQYFNHIEPKALYLMDLGYFKLDSFQKINSGQAYFISRYFIGSKLFTVDNQSIELIEVLQKAGSFYTQEVLLGANSKLKVRLLAQRLPDDVVEERVRKLKRDYQRRGKKVSARKLIFMRWNIFITNVPEDQMNPTEIFSAYGLRWQIELLFKLGKSGMGIDVLNSKKSGRVLVELYAKLLCLVLLLFFCTQAQLKNNKKISFFKACRYFFVVANDFIRALTSLNKLKLFTKEFLNVLSHSATKEIRKKNFIQTPCLEANF